MSTAPQESRAILDHFLALSDPRQSWRVGLSVAGNPAFGALRDALWDGGFCRDPAPGRGADGFPAAFLSL